VKKHGEEDYVVNGAVGEAQDERDAPGFCAYGVGEGVGWSADVVGRHLSWLLFD
jgi:hypothetical protein